MVPTDGDGWYGPRGNGSKFSAVASRELPTLRLAVMDVASLASNPTVTAIRNPLKLIRLIELSGFVLFASNSVGARMLRLTSDSLGLSLDPPLHTIGGASRSTEHSV